MHRIRLTCLAIVLAAGSACAGVENAGTTAGNFLSVGSGASVLGMGGATIGGGDDLNAAAWNPAALARMGTTQLALSHATLGQLSSQDLAAAGGRVGHGATRWGASLLYQGEGAFDGRDALGGPTGTFNVSSMALGVQVARPLGSAVTAGLGARWLNDNLGDATGSGMAFDFGLQAHTGPLGLGVVARNVGGSMSYPSGRYDLPAVYGAGAFWNDAAHGLRLALDANFPHAYYDDVRLGAEWRWQDRVALRAGYRKELNAAAGEPLGGPSFGLGLGANGIFMDYAFLAGNTDAQGQHRFGLTFRPGFHGGGPRPAAVSRTSAIPANGTERVAAAVPDYAGFTGREEYLVAPSDPASGQAGSSTPASPAGVPDSTETAIAATAPAPLSVLDQLVQRVGDRLPPGGSESEVSPRELVPLHSLAPSPLVVVAELVGIKLSGSAGDGHDAEVAVADVPVAAPQAAPRSSTPRVKAARPAKAKPVVAPVAVAPAPAVAPVAVARPAAQRHAAVAPPVAAPVAVARPVAAPPVAAPVAIARPVAAPPVAAPVAVARPVAAPPVAAPVAVARPVAAPPVAAPVAVARPVAAPPVAAPVAVARPVAASPVAAPVAVARPVMPRRAAATVAVAPPVVAAPAPAAVAVVAPVTAPPAITLSEAPAVAVNHPVRAARAPRAAPAPKPAEPAVTPPASVPAIAAPPEDAPPTASPTPAPAAPTDPPSAPDHSPRVKTYRRSGASAAMPKAQYAGLVHKVTIVTLPSSTPSTAPITRAVPPGPRPASVNASGNETLADIAKRWDTSVPALMMENNLVSAEVKSGQKLILPPPLHP